VLLCKVIYQLQQYLLSLVWGLVLGLVLGLGLGLQEFRIHQLAQ
jgi:hypothetical protein